MTKQEVLKISKASFGVYNDMIFMREAKKLVVTLFAGAHQLMRYRVQMQTYYFIRTFSFRKKKFQIFA